MIHDPIIRMPMDSTLIKSEPKSEAIRNPSLDSNGFFRLEDLPHDILSILPFPDKDEARRPDITTLYNLCLVNKNFNEIFTPRLYSYCTNPKAPRCLNRSGIHKLKKTLVSKPHLGRYVKTLEIGIIWETRFYWTSELETFVPGGMRHEDLEHAWAITRSIFAKTPNLQFLWLSTPSLVPCDSELPNLAAVWLSSSTKFEDPFTSEHAIYFLSLPRLCGIKLTCVHWQNDANALATIESRSSAVTVLDVENIGPPRELWPHLLRIPKALKVLTWRNVFCNHSSFHSSCDHCTVDEIQEGLDKVAPDLEELELEWTAGMSCQLLQTTSLDCREFQVLKTLKIPCRFLIGPAGCPHESLPPTIRQAPPRELASRLPCSLERFYLTVYTETQRSHINEILRGILDQRPRLSRLRTIALILKGEPPSDCLLCNENRLGGTVDSLIDFRSLKAVGKEKGIDISADDEQSISDVKLSQAETA